MVLMLLTGQRVFGAIGVVSVISAFFLYGTGGSELGFTASMKLMKWYPLLTLTIFVFMGYLMSERRIANDLYRMFHVWMGPLNGGLAIGTIGLMMLISAMNGQSVAGIGIGATIALPELFKRGYDKLMITRVIQAGLLPLLIFVSMMVLFLNGWTSLFESSALGAVCAFAMVVICRRMTLVVFEELARKTLGITCMIV